MMNETARYVLEMSVDVSKKKKKLSIAEQASLANITLWDVGCKLTEPGGTRA
jgi:hypothetical protein